MEKNKPQVVIVSGPSGSGKSTLVEKILEMPGTMFSVSCTTRPPRPAEAPGKWYDFISEGEFDRMVRQGEFLEHAQVFGKHWYGTPKRWLEEARREGKDLVLEIDVQGAMQVKKKLASSVAIFIVPPSRQELERRLRERGQDSDDEIRRRLWRAREEMQRYAEYDYVVVNETLDCAGREVQAIVTSLRCRRSCRDVRVQSILDSFGGL